MPTEGLSIMSGPSLGSRMRLIQFLMPPEMAIENNKTLEIMDFPPNTLITNRDYLNSKTTDRWFAMLEENGVPSSGVQSFTAILDIAPIAAPANDGPALLAANAYGGDFDSIRSGVKPLPRSLMHLR